MRRLTGVAIAAVLVWALLAMAFPVKPVEIHVRWAPQVTRTERSELERRFQLEDPRPADSSAPTTWAYQLANTASGNIRALVQDGRVEDTDGLDRSRYRPASEAWWDGSQRILVLSLTSAVAGVVLIRILPIVLIILAAGRRHAALFRWSAWTDVNSAMSKSPGAIAHRPHNGLVTAAVLVTGVLISVAMTSLAGAALMSSLAALAIVYAGGYLTGSLLVARVDTLSFAIVRTVAGLMLTSMAFLLSLMLHLPWFVAPIVLLVTALALRGQTAFAWPHQSIRITGDGVVGGLLVAILLSPIAIAFCRMAPGPFPPVFYNVDTAYGLEKVHALVVANSFPPPSLSNLGVVRTYHYGIHSMAALVSRGSGLLPHHALFLIVLPLLAIGMVAAAVAAARLLAPALPLSITVPLLLLAAPVLTRGFSDGFGPSLWEAATSRTFTLDWIRGDYELWGILSNEAQNSDFLIVGSIAAIAAAPGIGWTLAAFLIGTSVLFKTTTGIALVAGFMLSEAWQAFASKRDRPSGQMFMTGAVFAATFGLFFLTSFDSAFRVELYPFEHIGSVVNPNGLVSERGFFIDTVWLLLPALVVVTAKRDATRQEDGPFLLMAFAPLIVINTTRLVHVGNGGGGAGLDWVQIPRAVPFLVHAYALSVAGKRWQHLGRPRRVAFLAASALVITPVVIAASSYSSRLLQIPESGHEFADNRSIAQALSVIPIEGSVIVTNDLRYPAENFGRDDRQMQIPAVFGHQAFSANFAYEPIEDRRELQRLFQRPEWSDAILTAARTNHWTHFLVRKDYVHPAPIPLRLVFENDSYAVYRFP